MEEYLIPSKYVGDGYGISVMFAGLNQDKYDLLELSLDGVSYKTIERDSENTYCSKPILFIGLEKGLLYKVYGRITIDNVVSDIECSVLSQDGNDADEIDINALKQNTANANLFNSSNTQLPQVM